MEQICLRNTAPQHPRHSFISIQHRHLTCELRLGLFQAAACPPDPTKKAAMSTSFYRYFAAPDAAPPECQDPAACVKNAACWRRLLGAQIRGVTTETEAVEQALRCCIPSMTHVQRSSMSITLA